MFSNDGAARAYKVDYGKDRAEMNYNFSCPSCAVLRCLVAKVSAGSGQCIFHEVVRKNEWFIMLGSDLCGIVFHWFYQF